MQWVNYFGIARHETVASFPGISDVKMSHIISILKEQDVMQNILLHLVPKNLCLIYLNLKKKQQTESQNKSNIIIEKK